MPQSSWSAIVARVTAQMATIANMGNIHNRIRIAQDQKSFGLIVKASIGADTIGRAWMVSMDAMDTEAADSGGDMQWERRIVIEGFFEIPDGDPNSAELTAQSFGESVIRTLWTDLRTTKLDGTVLSGKPAKIVKSEPRLLMFMLAFYLRLEMPVTTIEI